MASKNAKCVVVKIGGSFLLADGNPNIAVLIEIADTVREMVKMGYRVVAVVGGGVAARQYIAAAAALGANNG
jgi:uridylate kinase